MPFAAIAQVGGVLSHLAFESGIIMGLLPAALGNTFLVFYLVLDLWRGEAGFRFARLAWLGFIASTAGLFSYLVFEGPWWNMSPAYLIVTGLATAITVRLQRVAARPEQRSKSSRAWRCVIAEQPKQRGVRLGRKADSKVPINKLRSTSRLAPGSAVIDDSRHTIDESLTLSVGLERAPVLPE